MFDVYSDKRRRSRLRASMACRLMEWLHAIFDCNLLFMQMDSCCRWCLVLFVWIALPSMDDSFFWILIAKCIIRDFPTPDSAVRTLQSHIKIIYRKYAFDYKLIRYWSPEQFIARKRWYNSRLQFVVNELRCVLLSLARYLRQQRQGTGHFFFLRAIDILIMFVFAQYSSNSFWRRNGCCVVIVSISAMLTEPRARKVVLAHSIAINAKKCDPSDTSITFQFALLPHRWCHLVRVTFIHTSIDHWQHLLAHMTRSSSTQKSANKIMII